MPHETPDPRPRPNNSPPSLSARQIRFCQLYVETGVLTRSYIKAGFPHKSEDAAYQRAKRQLGNVRVRAFLAELRTVAADAARLSVALVAQGLFRDGWADRRKLFAADGTMLPPAQWPDDVAATVQSVEIEEVGPRVEGMPPRLKVKIKTTDRLRAKQIAAQWLRMIGAGSSDVEDKEAPAPLVIEKGPAHIPPPPEPGSTG